jgi:chromosome segregation ATPase
MARFDGELGGLRQSETAARAVFDEKEAARSGAENALRRAEAKLSRVQIEIRGVLDLARKALGPGGGDLPPEQAAKVTQLQARATAIEPEVAQANGVYSAAGAQCDQARVEVRRLQAQLRKLEQQKRSAESSLGAQVSVRAAGVSEAEKQRRDALAVVAQAILLARGSVPVPEPTLEALRHHDKVAEAHAIRLETHVRALSSYDRERVKLGVILVLSALGVVLLSILLKAML